MTTRELVYVEWVDSCGCSSRWELVDEDFQVEVMRCASVGWVIREDDDALLIAPNLAAANGPELHDQVIGHMSIPKVAITRRVAVKVPKRERKP